MKAPLLCELSDGIIFWLHSRSAALLIVVLSKAACIPVNHQFWLINPWQWFNINHKKSTIAIVFVHNIVRSVLLCCRSNSLNQTCLVKRSGRDFMSTYTFAVPETVALPVAGTDAKFPVRRVYCIGRNYAAHAVEMGHDPDREPPFFFQKNPNNLDPSGQFRYPVSYTHLTLPTICSV